MPITKGKSKYTGKQIAVSRETGKLDLTKFRQVYKNAESIKEGHLEHGDAPIKLTTKSGRTLYYHAKINRSQVLVYEELYRALEEMVKSGKIKYNPLTRMIFKEARDGTYFALDTHQGITLRELRYKEQFEHADKIIGQIVDIWNMFMELGYDHGHLHDGNICVDKNGNVKIIDISYLYKMNRVSLPMNFYNAVNNFVMILNVFITAKVCPVSVAKNYKGLKNIPIELKEQIIAELKKYLYKLRNIPEHLIDYQIEITRQIIEYDK